MSIYATLWKLNTLASPLRIYAVVCAMRYEEIERP
jgi:hypothetical protein